METALRLIISGDSTGAQKALADVNKAAKGLDGPSQRLGELGGKLSGVGRDMSVGVTLPLLAVGAGAVKVAADFETSMNMVQEAAGASSRQMADLEQYAKDMGAATVFSAGEAAEAMLELAKAGMTPAQIKGGALKATMDLAAAGNLQLADAATITSNAMNTFGLSAKDATSVAAALAGGANASSADVSDLSLALSQTGAGAKNAGLSLQETVAVLAAFADQGIKGSDAGTSLKTMLQRLVPQTDKAAKTMADLGISFVNADGSMKSIDEVAEILQTKLGGLSDEQRTLALQTMFGSDATRAATVLMREGKDGLEKYTKATNDQSAAADMANARMKGTAGAIEQMKGSVETAMLSMGEALAPVITDLAGGIKTLADLFAGMPGWAQKAVVGAGIIVGALGPILVITGKILSGFQQIRNFRWSRANVGGAATPTVGGVGAAGGAADGGATGNVVKLGTASGITAGEVATLGRAAAGASGKAAGAGTQLGNVGGKAKTAAGQIGPMGSAAKTTVQPLANLTGGAKTAAPEVRGLGKVSSTAGGKFGKLNTALGNSTVGSIGASIAFGAALSFTIPKVLEAGDAFMQWMDALETLNRNRESKKDTASAFAAKVTEKYGSPEAYLAYLANKFGKDSDQYKNALYALGINTGTYNPATRWGGKQAAGGDYWVTRPTLFLAGEAGPERATFTPQGKGSAGGVQIHVHVHGGNFIGTDRQAARRLAELVGPDVRAQLTSLSASGF